jgi:hypothetical protein
MAGIEALPSKAPSLLVAVIVMHLAACAGNRQPEAPKTDDALIAEQIVPCWNFDAGIEHPENYTVVVEIAVQPDGRITDAKIVRDTSRLSDPTYRRVADSVLRAVRNPMCNVLKLPQGKSWSKLDIVFDLEKAINGGY